MSSPILLFARQVNLDGNDSGKAQQAQGISIKAFLASLASAAVIFAVQFLLFVLLKDKLSRIYRPRTYLVPEKERTVAPPTGFIAWILPIFKTSNAEFIQKCGLDAYFFLRFLRTLLKIFIPLAALILPILLPLNYVGGRGTPDKAQGGGPSNVTGLDQLAWGNVRPEQTHRYWAHLVLALVVIIYVCYVFFDELRKYIRLRQAYLTSPQHRLRASATTVLVTAIPRKWLTIDALDGLYDVFPGGIRNIWINRNFDALSEKVKLRQKYARKLEAAETDLIRNAKKAQVKQEQKHSKKAGQKMSKQDKAEQKQQDDADAVRLAEGNGTSSGDPHQVRHTLFDVFHQDTTTSSQDANTNKPLPVPILGQGLQAVGHGIGAIGAIGGTVLGGFKKAGKGVDERLTTTGGFVPEAGEGGAPPPRRDEFAASSRRPGETTAGNVHTDGAAEVHPAHRAQTETATGGHSSSSQPPRHDARNLTVPSVDGAGDTRGFDPRLPGPSGAGADGQRRAVSGSKRGWMAWSGNRNSKTYNLPSPQPTTKAGKYNDERPLTALSPATPRGNMADYETDKAKSSGKSKWSWIPFVRGKGEEQTVEYPAAYNAEFEDDKEGDPVWKRYLKPKDRDTMRLPIFGWQWMPSLPLIGKKVDTILYCRKELARLNVEIEKDQQNPEDFPLMNSAFVQFNHQVAAHMACQSVSHHVPKHMAPRIVEISPDDVLWDNMSVKWWERDIRTAVVLTVVVGLIIGWAVPVSLTGLISQLAYLENFKFLAWIAKLPQWLISFIQGVLPVLFLAILMAVLPLILRFLAKQQGVQTGMGVELSVQNYYFAFLFVQLFLVVSVSSAFTTAFDAIKNNPASIALVLAQELPKATNYFFSYMILQALSISAGVLLQIGQLITWFILGPILDNTARQKWARQTDLPYIRWGTFFPVYTNLAAIGLIYSVISPLILVFNIITFGLFWIAYRYTTLYVTKFRFDTGGLLFPRAINQLFTGLYFMELCLIGLFFLARDKDNKVACLPQAIIMIVALFFTVIYQWLLNDSFGPLFRYLPITLEDEAVERDEEFAKAQRKRLNLGGDDEDPNGEDIEDRLEDRERREHDADHAAEDIEMKEIENRRRNKFAPNNIATLARGTWADRSRKDRARSQDFGHYPKVRPEAFVHGAVHDGNDPTGDLEAQRQDPVGEALFSGINDEIEDLTPHERDQLIQRAFQHEAMRAKRPVVWMPRDNLGVADDEIYRTQRFSKHIWVSNEYTGLDSKSRVLYRRSPPDFSEVDLIEL